MLKPYGSKILVEALQVEAPRMGSFLMPDTVAKDLPPCQGKVIATGPRVSKVRDGDVVLYGLGVGTEYENFVFIEETDVICRIN